MIPIRGPIAPESEMGAGSVAVPLVQAKDRIATQNEITDQARKTEGRERNTQTFHQMPAECFWASCIPKV